MHRIRRIRMWVFAMPFCLCSLLAAEPSRFLLLNPSTLWLFLPHLPTNGARGPNTGSNVGSSVWKICIRKNMKKKEHDEVARGITKLSSTWLKESYIGMFRRGIILGTCKICYGNRVISSLKEHCSVSIRMSYFPSVQLFFIYNTMLSYKLCVIVLLKFWSLTPIIRYPTSFCCLFFFLLTYAFLCMFWFFTWFWMFSFFKP